MTNSHPGAIQGSTQGCLIRTKDSPITQKITRVSGTLCQKQGTEKNIFFLLQLNTRKQKTKKPSILDKFQLNYMYTKMFLTHTFHGIRHFLLHFVEKCDNFSVYYFPQYVIVKNYRKRKELYGEKCTT